jgi:hypothetical protein
MKAKLYIITAISFLLGACSSTPKKQAPSLQMIQLSDSTYISKTDSGILLPTSYFLDDSIPVFTENIIAESDCIFPANQYREKADTLYLKGDTLYYKGDSVPKDLTYTKYDTEIVLKTEGIYIYSNRALERCQINLEYTEPAIFNKIFGRFSSRSNRTLKFLKIQSNRYVYFAPYENWENGGFAKFDNMKIMYDPERREGYPLGFFNNEKTFKKKDFETHFPHFKAYLIQQ